MKKSEIASVLTEIGTLLELKGENPFKTRAYQSGARVIESLSEEELERRVAAGTLGEIKGLGEALVQKVTELHTTGKLEFFEKLKASLPAGLLDLMSIPGVGPKKVKALHDKLGVDSITALQAACEAGKVAELEGFGAKTQEKIMQGIRNREAYGRRHLWIAALEAGAPILAGLKSLPQVQQAESCGSFRRRMETVGDLDFLVATTEPGPVVAWFVSQPEVKEITAQGDLKASVRLKSGLQADLRLVPPEQFVFTLHHLTGSKDHNVQMRQRALERGLSMSEWGLFPSDQKHGPTELGAKGKGQSASGESLAAPTLAPGTLPFAIKTEADLFKHLGLAFIPPELREGLGEIEAAELEVTSDKGQVAGGETPNVKDPNAKGGEVPSDKGQVTGGETPNAKPEEKSRPTTNAQQPTTTNRQPTTHSFPRGLPLLIEESDIRGVFHNHTTASDGHNTLEEMVAGAEALGFEYLGIADHSKSSFQARGLDEGRLLEQVGAIKRLNESKKFRTWVFSGTECDILPDGRLDFAPEILAQLDYVVVSIHSSFQQDRETMTQRIIKAIESPHVTMLAHLTGRLLLEREGYEVETEKVIDAAIANRVAIEINANPYRLDMDWRHWRKAAEKGLLTSINPDAHRVAQLDFFRVGVGVARKGWLGKGSVVNTKTLVAMQSWLRARGR